MAASNGTALLRVENLERTYLVGEIEVRALRGVSAEIRAGEFVAIQGPSGSGKSTFMNLLGCLDRPTGGRYLLDGTDVSGFDAAQRARIRNRRIGFVFQSFNLLPRTTALENVEVPLLYSEVPGSGREPRALRVLEEVGLADRVHHYPSQLSGGQQQRVAIARALVTEPRVLLADEPTGNLDSRTSLEIMALLQALNRERGMTVLIVTHEADIAGYANRAILFHDGLIRSDEAIAAPRDAQQELAAMPPEPAGA